MDFQPRASYSSWGHSGEDNGSLSWDFQQPVLDVAPLSCVPCIGPPPPLSNAASASSTSEINSSTPFGGQPAMVFLTSQPTNDEWSNIISATKSGVALTGSAALGQVGPAIGSVDIAESQNEYLFRVSLPGVVRDEKFFTYTFQPDGKIMIKGVTSTGEKTICKDSMVFEMQTQNLCPPGDFSISFQLPGPIDHLQVTTAFGSDGVFEGVVKKRIAAAC